eukprot:gnl/MRDRNA2_/MRDRNA2_78453_c0_seq1.p1 gnl/MRDRNA2_/MRDRNA2_78453_c0~~gnl/MRDRNA2_/MRDRNA2_78453_c0_seq1.p1  ORF type:complete len:167 (+),score=5.91 gnl/MRDRNA2_/MRDRNA2_78453_c0_seq1:30-503(+)
MLASALNFLKSNYKKTDQPVHVGRREIISGLMSIYQTNIADKVSKAGFLGGISEDEYQNETYSLANLAKEVSTMQKDTSGKEQKVDSLKTEINRWVAKYRREPKFGGRPSYNNMYSAVNALSGHFNTFGPSAPVPKKRLDRVIYELDQASLFLSRGR